LHYFCWPLNFLRISGLYFWALAEAQKYNPDILKKFNGQQK